jgi:hypothetical protein
VISASSAAFSTVFTVTGLRSWYHHGMYVACRVPFSALPYNFTISSILEVAILGPSRTKGLPGVVIFWILEHVIKCVFLVYLAASWTNLTNLICNLISHPVCTRNVFP